MSPGDASKESSRPPVPRSGLFDIPEWNIKGNSAPPLKRQGLLSPNAAKKAEKNLLKRQKRKQKLQEMLSKQGDSKSKDQATSAPDEGGNDRRKRPRPAQLQSAATRADSGSGESDPVTSGKGNLSVLQQKMHQKLQGAKFRWINEQLYTTSSQNAFEMMQSDPQIFTEYHLGFSSQVSKWPINPVDVFIADLRDNYIRPNKKKARQDRQQRVVVADMGCGEAKLAKVMEGENQKGTGKQVLVYSFDLVKANECITPCDIAHVPLEDGSVDIVIFCLSLMGTNWLEFIREARRILKPRQVGELKVAEVVSRFTDIDAFLRQMDHEGFQLTKKDDSNKMFILMEWKKSKRQAKMQADSDVANAAGLLKACIYKRR
ncbi:25S rRNA (adenine645-N1)-methyltransferase [Spiromyces aspiralis]|uniref:25S rRNA (Adenine645-N1)-methyltransferase n=1 Tax=Spiromyces aspiralis TaxID=68401 RepID=A0ACC1HGZ6_9FUNG|nr:25S rRNA (adenine645-N1)-methyltransferase [Spiromyces aspiralis]